MLTKMKMDFCPLRHMRIATWVVGVLDKPPFQVLAHVRRNTCRDNFAEDRPVPFNTDKPSLSSLDCWVYPNEATT